MMRAVLLIALVATASAWLLNPHPRVGCPAGHYNEVERAPKQGSRSPRQWRYGTNVFAWSGLCKMYEKCNHGFHQSPINIPSKSHTTGNLHVMYGVTQVEFVRVDQVVTMPVTGSHMLDWQNKTWQLSQLEFHHPSEHAIDGEHHDFEVQLYHKREDHNGVHWAAISVLFDVDQCNNDFLDRLWPIVPHVWECECGNARTEDYAPFGEQCDCGTEDAAIANANEPNHCRANCTLPACGDFIIDDLCGEQCDNGTFNARLPDQCRPNCTLPACGDGIVDGKFGEQCDFGLQFNQVPPINGGLGLNGTQCDALCRWTCGNGRIDAFLNGTGYKEECDDGAANTDEPNVRGACRKGHPNPLVSGLFPEGKSLLGGCVRQRCGDGILDSGISVLDAAGNDLGYNEACDDGPGSELGAAVRDAPNRCRPGCLAPTCGNGQVDDLFGEQCEPPNSANCDAQCRFIAFCGDGAVNGDEQCDSGNATNSNTVPNACRRNCQNPTCGDGVTDDGEECDDVFNGVAGSCRCNPNCSRRCGNSFINGAETIGSVECPAEECDNGFAAVLPNGLTVGRPFFPITDDPALAALLPAGRTDGNSDVQPNACRVGSGASVCTLFKCGDGVVDNLWYRDEALNRDLGGEQCDTGVGPVNGLSNTTKDACRLNCCNPTCGDGVTDSGEECDDGNVTQPGGNENALNTGCSQDCKQLCGDGVRGDGEDCDDGHPGSGFEIQRNSNTTKNACRLNCREHFCGDGVTDDDEECDFASPGRLDNTCLQNCKLTYCGDGITQHELGEECDAGLENSWATPRGCSPICTVNRCGSNTPSPAVQVNLKDLVPTLTGPAYAYQGSWTHPPCTENVNWLVLKNRQRIGIDQLWAWQKWVGRNSRPVQHIGSRQITIPSRFGAPERTQTCGNGWVEFPEECDDGRTNSDLIPNACRKSCRAAHCGDGVIDQGEQCDFGTAAEWPEWCARTCQIVHKRYSWYDKKHNNTCPWWNYDNEGVWHHLGAGCEHCGGNRQSPIDLPKACPLKTRALTLNHPANVHYSPVPVVLFNTGQNILFPVHNGGTFSFHGKTYTLEHIEFHEPSEHYIAGKRFAFEVQLHHNVQNPGVHQKAVIAVLFEAGCDANEWLDKFWSVLPTQHECRCGNGIKEDLYYWPDGSVTKEECDNGHLNADHVANACRTNCRLPRCGDGVVDMGEACDWGAANSDSEPNHCRTDCTVPMCGDGVIDHAFGERCDDGNCANRDGCDSHCQPECGNGLIDSPLEECDNGTRNSDTAASACRADCKLPKCGDGVVDEGEECDMGSFNSDTLPNRCRTTCTWPKCGDGVADPMNLELCDEGIAGGNGCTPVDEHHGGCRLLCGNGKLDAGEECDNGAANSDKIPNACRTNCRNATCGDSVRDSFEECDGPSPWCNDKCKVCCGNGILECDCTTVAEECDHGVLNSDSRPSACRTNCKIAHCGDGVVDSWIPGSDCFEECDNGAHNSDTEANACRSNCKNPYCGDGVLDKGEQCDDGNNRCGDGCTGGCQLECGNGRIDPGEECDDGHDNGMTPGCCRADCKLPKCGDGITDWGEECDDGALNKDAPNHCRTNCTLPVCGDGIIDNLYFEKCDKAHQNSETAIDGCSPRCTPNLCVQSVNMDLKVNPHDVLPKAPGAYCYDGSVNHPPCTEDAQWFVFASPSHISECQLKAFRRILHNNTRHAQPLNGRTVSFLEEKAVCGDGIVEGNEECDTGPHRSDHVANACRKNCRKAHCGDGVQDAGEQCDGTPNCNAGCRLSCPSSTCPNCNATTPSGGNSVINVNFAGISTGSK